MFTTLSKSNIYRYKGKEVVFVEFNYSTCEVLIRDMSGQKHTVKVWELGSRTDEREDDGTKS